MKLLSYEKDVLKESNNLNLLLIMAKGLGIENIITYNIKMYLNEYSSVILLNFDDTITEYITKDIKSKHLYLVNNLSTSIEKRRSLYKKGGVYIVSSRIFIADMISEIINIEKISSIFINQIENIEDNSTEAFIIYLLRRRNTACLVKAFSENPYLISIKYSGLENILKTLKINDVLFYPRFHKKVQESLVIDTKMIEVRLNLPQNVVELQILTMEIIFGLVKEIQKEEKYLELEQETALVDNFNKIMKFLLGVSKNKPRIRRLLKDVRNMKILLYLLFSLNISCFYEFFKILFDEQISLGKGSSWINLPCAHVLMDKAKEFSEVEQCNEIEPPEKDVQKDIIKDSSSQEEESSETDTPVISKSFYKLNLNKKVGKLIEIVKDVQKGVIIILVTTQYIREILNDLLNDLLKDCGLEIRKNEEKNLEISENTLLNYVKMESKRIKIEQNKTTKILTHEEFKYFNEDYDFVIFLEPNIGSIRKIEFYRNSTLKDLKVYFMIYKDSLEEQKYLNEMRNEKNAFEKLIEAKSRMPLNLDKVEDEIIDLEEQEDAKREFFILIDFREMRSSLPFFLYKAQNIIKITTLETGDFLLGPNLCVERKNIQDFIQSVASGRLYLQSKMMIYKYANPYLLLEFDNRKRPCLSDYYNYKEESFKNSILSKFILFILNFPKLKIIWSNSDITTVKIFRSLQKRNENPPIDQTEVKAIDPVLQEIILNVPGVNYFNFKKIIQEFKNIKDLAFADIGKIEKVAGKENGKLIFNFFRNKISD